MTHEGLHEAAELLDEATVDRHRAIESLIEELEAIDWYDQRVKATRDPELAAILAHNRDDEKEHAAMALEWIRRQDRRWTGSFGSTSSPRVRSSRSKALTTPKAGPFRRAR